jgi:surface protein
MFALADSYRADEKLAWNTSKVTNMNCVFYKAPSFNGDISSWDTSKVTRMDAMFNGAISFNGNLSSWNTKKVTDFSLMFSDATLFNGDLSLWDTSMVSTMYAMFYLTPLFNGDISQWNTMRVANMTALFYRATTFNGVLSYWNTSSLRETRVMFLDAVSFNSDLISWNTSRVTNMNSMFYNATSFNGNIRSWDTSRVLDMSQMFAGAKVFNQTLCWNTSIALKVNVFADSRGSFSALTFPSCLTSAPTAKPSIRTTYRSTHKPTIWPKPWMSYTSVLYGNTTSDHTFNRSTCPEGTKVVRIWGRSANWIIQLSATCDDKSNTVLGPWGQPQGTSGVVPPCADGYNGWTITYGSFIGQIAFACASSSFVMGPALGSGFAFGAGNTNRTLLSRNQSIIGFQVYYDSLGIHAMKFEYAELPSKGRCLNAVGDPTGRCPSKTDWFALLWGFLTMSGLFGICGFIFVRVRRRRHKMEFKAHDAILPLK